MENAAWFLTTALNTTKPEPALHATKDTVLLTENVLLTKLEDHQTSDARLGIGTMMCVLNAHSDLSSKMESVFQLMIIVNLMMNLVLVLLATKDTYFKMGNATLETSFAEPMMMLATVSLVIMDLCFTKTIVSPSIKLLICLTICTNAAGKNTTNMLLREELTQLNSLEQLIVILLFL